MIRNCDTFIFYDEVKYTKNDWRNRNQVCSDKGTHWITIQVSSDSVNKKINDVTLDYNKDWRQSHLSLLEFCYSKAPLFKKQLRPLMQHFLLEFQTNRLSELNQYIIKFISKEAGFKTQFKSSEDFNLDSGKIERLLSLLVQAGTNEYITGPAAKDYLAGKESIFQDNGIKLIYYNYPDYKKYGPQRDFYNKYISILDFLAFEELKDLDQYFEENHV